MPSNVHCDTCAFFHQVHGSVGLCRKSAPTIPLLISGTTWPNVTTKDWCGDHPHFYAGKDVLPVQKAQSIWQCICGHFNDDRTLVCAFCHEPRDAAKNPRDVIKPSWGL